MVKFLEEYYIVALAFALVNKCQAMQHHIQNQRLNAHSREHIMPISQ